MKKRSGGAGKSLLKKTEAVTKINRSRGEATFQTFTTGLEDITCQSPISFLQLSSNAFNNAQNMRSVIMHQCEVCEQRQPFYMYG